MKIKSLTPTFTLAVALLLTACGGANLDPKEFIEEAARGGMGETQMSRIALQRSQNAEIKSFAEEMIGSHSKIDVELAGVAGKKGVTLPRETSSTQKSTASKLESLNGEAFDKEFVNALIKDHENTIKLFQTHASNSPDADIKAFAVANLPKFQEHLQHAQNLKAKMPQ